MFRLLTRRRLAAASDASGKAGVMRVDRRTKNLTKRLEPGDIAIIDHRDLDRVSAEALVAARPCAVVNASRSISGRYPNLGPEIILEAGIPLLDNVGDGLLAKVKEGQVGRLDGEHLLASGSVVATGERLHLDQVREAMVEARLGLSEQLEAFAANTMDYLVKERDLLIEGSGNISLRTSFVDRHALIVVRGYHYREDLQMLRSYIREYRPVLVGVDGGADALLEEGHTPDLIVGDMDSVSDLGLRCGAEVVVHAYRDGRAPGLERVKALGIDPVVLPATGTSEDVAMLLADDCGAELIVAVGTHATLVEFLDKGRAGMASTFLTRLRVGSKLVDAKGVSRLYRSRISNRSLVGMLFGGLLALLAALGSTPAGTAALQVAAARWDDMWSWFSGIFT